MKSIIAITLLLCISTLGSQSLACSCMSWANAQQTALADEAIVAQVSTSAVSQRGMGLLNIEKVHKGDLQEQNISILGQDGANCSGPILPPSVGSWIAIFTQDKDGKYSLYGCADTSLKINSEGKISMNFSEEVLVSEEEFKKLITEKARPTVKGASCQAYASRLYISHDVDKGALPDIDFNDYLKTDLGTSVTYAKDLFGEGPGIAAPLIVNLGAYKGYKSEWEYRMGVRLTEPFFGVTNYSEFTFDIRNILSIGTVILSTNQDVNGQWGENFGEDPFYAYESVANCGLILGAPIVEIN